MIVLDILTELENTSKTLEKNSILTSYKNNILLKDVIFNALNPYMIYYIKEKTLPKKSIEGGSLSLKVAMDEILPKLSKRLVTGNDAVLLVEKTLNELSSPDAEVFSRIILKDLKCGISDKSVNKVWPKLIAEVPYMRCSGIEKIKNIKYPAMVQEKSDGVFCNIIIENGDVKFLTRNGTYFQIEPLSKIILKAGIDNIVLIGEMLVTNSFGEIESRKIGNGKINKVLKENQSKETLNIKINNASATSKKRLLEEMVSLETEIEIIKNSIIMNLWDVIEINSWKNGKYGTKYSERFDSLIKLLETYKTPKFQVIPYKLIDNLESAYEFTNEMYKLGKEGAVLKNLDNEFKDGTATDQIKLKQVRDADLVCVGWYPGKPGTEFENGIGGFNLESSDGIIKVNVGSGVSREQRGMEPIDPTDIAKGLKVIEGFDFNQYVGKIFEVQYNELIQSDTKEGWSLFLPRVVEVRLDKSIADSFDRIKSMQ